MLIVECGGAGAIDESGISYVADDQVIVSKLDTDKNGGFEVQGDKTKFATLQRQRRQLYDDLRDSKCRAQVNVMNLNCLICLEISWN